MTKALILASLFVTAIGCQSAPAVRGVWSIKHLEAISPADQDLFHADRASRIRTASRLLPIAERGEEFHVTWSGRAIDIVQFECRQLNLPDKITAQDFRVNGQTATTFWIRGDDFRKGGSISAWRVTLWRNGELLSEKHSMAW